MVIHRKQLLFLGSALLIVAACLLLLLLVAPMFPYTERPLYAFPTPGPTPTATQLPLKCQFCR
ncbi:hypothetical protein EI42_00665 [Thermosporothrix hazakensis]|jgi:hypothetical protein|uniref:Uncharacterized protein n=2 Tax=Thermosporothrix TaxID=768650 RepID=A0A326UR69_THEHA|nr:hypothetical protein [Thermosporothrix hazakensis]PZW36489.1 hypothetical protein EI42_00665 [Thermosporothrix hazakensis]BBH88958.1 hypothetical protein KTC_37090 [Thermosporothrix sp. COM3]GCE47143.1 hypothetical protein KTH_20120 [Thermosporothrix hazakensis]